MPPETTPLYYTILYYTILYYTILYYTILYYPGFQVLQPDTGRASSLVLMPLGLAHQCLCYQALLCCSDGVQGLLSWVPCKHITIRFPFFFFFVLPRCRFWEHSCPRTGARKATVKDAFQCWLISSRHLCKLTGYGELLFPQSQH
jgi:hypothetical protein